MKSGNRCCDFRETGENIWGDVKEGGKAGARHRFKPSVYEGFMGRREKDGDWRGGVIIEI